MQLIAGKTDTSKAKGYLIHKDDQREVYTGRLLTPKSTASNQMETSVLATKIS